MGYRALLFCPDEKTARTVTQVLSELDFAVEPSTEPFVAVKKLMAQHFDAIVVDCDNEQITTCWATTQKATRSRRFSTRLRRQQLRPSEPRPRHRLKQSHQRRHLAQSCCLHIRRRHPLRAHILPHPPPRVRPRPRASMRMMLPALPRRRKWRLVGRFTPGKILCCPIILLPTLRLIRPCPCSHLPTSPPL